MNKMKIFKLIMSISVPILLLGATISLIVLAWYVSMIQTGEIDATTKNLVVEYSFNKDTAVNKKTYTVRNLAFFDTDSESETSYLSSMAVKLEIKLKMYV